MMAESTFTHFWLGPLLEGWTLEGFLPTHLDYVGDLLSRWHN